MTGRWVLSVLAIVIGGAVSAACQPDVPFAPLFETDVKPVFMAHCVRCHGAGDMLRGEPYVNPATGQPTLDPSTGMPLRRLPMYCYLDRYDSVGDCPNGADCVMGARDCVGLLETRFPPMGGVPETYRMPPPPSEPLNEWEQEVLRRWLDFPLP
jgi:hypothetical protein